MKVWLLRHGRTAYNREQRYQGLRDIPLSPEGEAELRQADFAPETVWVSPLCRARRTAEILFPSARQVVVEDLREMDFGAFEGRNYAEMEHDPDYRAWVDSGCEGRCPGGESRTEFCDRVCGAMEHLLEDTLDFVYLQPGEPRTTEFTADGWELALPEGSAAVESFRFEPGEGSGMIVLELENGSIEFCQTEED